VTATDTQPAAVSREEIDGALGSVADQLGLRVLGRPVYGWRYRSIGAAVADAAGVRRWLRVGTEREVDLDAFWTGLPDANAVTGVRKPEVLASREWSEPHRGRRVRADLLSWMPGTPCSPTEILREDPTLPDPWWAALHDALAAVAATSTRRYADRPVREGKVRAVFGDQVADGVRDVAGWATQHGDLHWGNVFAPDFALMDWEMWGCTRRAATRPRCTCAACSSPPSPSGCTTCSPCPGQPRGARGADPRACGPAAPSRRTSRPRGPSSRLHPAGDPRGPRVGHARHRAPLGTSPLTPSTRRSRRCPRSARSRRRRTRGTFRPHFNVGARGSSHERCRSHPATCRLLVVLRDAYSSIPPSEYALTTSLPLPMAQG
jgi:hypothetical protein